MPFAFPSFFPAFLIGFACARGRAQLQNSRFGPIGGSLMFGTCPAPKSRYDRILLGHGSGGQLTADLIRRLFVPAFDNEILSAMEDQAIVGLDGSLHGTKGPRLAFTTDAFVVRPIFFPGG